MRDSIAIKQPPGSTSKNRPKGLFAARAFPKHYVLGRYIGKVIAKGQGETNPKCLRELTRLEQSLDGDALASVGGYIVDGRRPVQSNDDQIKTFGKVVLRQPTWSWPGMYAMMINDARGSPFENNVHCTRGGYMAVIQKIPAYHFGRSHTAKGNGASEILWDYGGDSYWNDSNKLGSSKNRAIYVN